MKPPPDDLNFDLVIGAGHATAIVLGFLAASGAVAYEFLIGGVIGLVAVVFTTGQLWDD